MCVSSCVCNIASGTFGISCGRHLLCKDCAGVTGVDDQPVLLLAVSVNSSNVHESEASSVGR